MVTKTREVVNILHTHTHTHICNLKNNKKIKQSKTALEENVKIE